MDLVKHFTEEASKLKSKSSDISIKHFIENSDKNFKELTIKNILKHPVNKRSSFHPILKDYSLFHVCEIFAKEKLRRIPIVMDDNKLIGIISQSKIIEYFYKNKKEIGKKGKKKISNIQNVLKQIISVEDKNPAMDAFNLMITKNINNIAIVNKDGKLVIKLLMLKVGVINVKDIKIKDEKLISKLLNKSIEFINDLNKNHNKPAQPITVTPNNTIDEVIDILFKNKLHSV
jgi:CBS domain-containing protein